MRKDNEPKLYIRILGGLEAAGGAVEIGAGTLLAAYTGGIGAILGGGLLIAHGADGVRTGSRRLRTGTEHKTLTTQALEPVMGEIPAVITDVTIGCFAPGTAITKLISLRNIANFGKATKPFLFRSINNKDIRIASTQLAKLTTKEVRTLKGEHDLLYVITKKGELVLTKNKLIKPIEVNGEILKYAIHPEIIGKNIPVVGAGQVKILNGKIVKIDNMSGHFRPNGVLLEKITEHVFIRRGFSEASGKFKYYQGISNVFDNPPIVRTELIWPTVSIGLTRTSESWFENVLTPSAWGKDINLHYLTDIDMSPGNVFENGEAYNLINSHLETDSKLTFYSTTGENNMPNTKEEFSQKQPETNNKPSQQEMESYLKSFLEGSKIHDEEAQNKVIEYLKDTVIPHIDKSFTDNVKIDLTGFENDPEVVKLVEKLHNLRQTGGSPQEFYQCYNKLENKKVKIQIDRAKFDKVVSDFNSIGSITSSIGVISKNRDIQRAGTVITSGVSIGAGAASLLGVAGAAMPPLGAVAAIIGGVAAIFSAFSDDDDPMAEAIARLAERVEHLINLVENLIEKVDAGFKLMEAYFQELINIWDMLYGLLDYVQNQNKVEHQTTHEALAYLTERINKLIVKMANDSLREEVKNIINKHWAARKKIEANRKESEDYIIETNKEITSPTGAVHHPMLTGANLPNLHKDPAGVSAHLNSLPANFNLGALAEIYDQLGFRYKNYSPKMMEYYFGKLLDGKANFNMTWPLAIEHLSISKNSLKKIVYGLEKEIAAFGDQQPSDSPNYLIIPFSLNANWQLILVDKNAGQVSLFASDLQPKLFQLLQTIITRSIPTDFSLQHKTLPEILPWYYGPMIVEIVKRLSTNETYDDILKESSEEKLSLLYESQTNFFAPNKKLLDTRQAALSKAINSILAMLLISSDLALKYYIYPEVTNTAATSDLSIPQYVVDDITTHIKILASEQQFTQAFSNPQFFTRLFRMYKDAKNELIAELDAYKKEHEDDLSNNLYATHEKLQTKFTSTELEQKFKKEEISTPLHDNWRLPLVPTAYRHWSQSALTDTFSQNQWDDKQQSQIKNSKENYWQNYVNTIRTHKSGKEINLYNDDYYAELYPPFQIPKEKSDPLLPLPDAISELVPTTMKQLLALNKGEVQFSYTFTNNDTEFLSNVCFIANDRRELRYDSCVAYTIPGVANNTALKFYSGKEKAWWFWNDGKIPAKETFDQTWYWYITKPKPLIGGREWGSLPSLWSSECRFMGSWPDSYWINRKGARTLEASNFTKTAGVPKSLSNPNISILDEYRINTYKKERKELRSGLKTNARLDDTTISKKLIRYELAFQVLTKFLEKFFPNHSNDSNSLIYKLLHDDNIVYNKATFLQELSEPSSTNEAIYISQRFTSDAQLDLAEKITLALLPKQAHKINKDLTSFILTLLGSRDDFLPYRQLHEESSMHEKLKFSELISKFYQGISDMTAWALAKENSGELQQRYGLSAEEVLELKGFLSHTLDDLKEKFNDNQISYEEAICTLQNLGIPLLTSGSDDPTSHMLLAASSNKTQTPVLKTEPQTSGAYRVEPLFGIYPYTLKAFQAISDAFRSFNIERQKLISFLASTAKSSQENPEQTAQTENQLTIIPEKNPGVHLETDQAIFTYYAHNETGEPVGTFSLYATPIPCRSKDGKQHNVIYQDGIFENISVEIKNIPDTCSYLPPTFCDIHLPVAFQAASLGAINGSANVAHNFLTEHGFNPFNSQVIVTIGKHIANGAFEYAITGSFGCNLTQLGIDALQLSSIKLHEWGYNKIASLLAEGSKSASKELFNLYLFNVFSAGQYNTYAYTKAATSIATHNITSTAVTTVAEKITSKNKEAEQESICRRSWNTCYNFFSKPGSWLTNPFNDAGQNEPAREIETGTTKQLLVL